MIAAKIEITLIWLLGIWAVVSGKDIAVFMSCIASFFVIIANYDKAAPVIKRTLKRFKKQ